MGGVFYTFTTGLHILWVAPGSLVPDRGGLPRRSLLPSAELGGEGAAVMGARDLPAGVGGGARQTGQGGTAGVWFGFQQPCSDLLPCKAGSPLVSALFRSVPVDGGRPGGPRSPRPWPPHTAAESLGERRR